MSSRLQTGELGTAPTLWARHGILLLIEGNTANSKVSRRAQGLKVFCAARGVERSFSCRAVGARVRGARGGCAGGHRPTRAAARSGGMAATKRGAVPKPWEGQERPSELKETCTGFSWTVNTDVETDTAIESEMSQSAERDAKLPRREEYVTMDAL